MHGSGFLCGQASFATIPYPLVDLNLLSASSPNFLIYGSYIQVFSVNRSSITDTIFTFTIPVGAYGLFETGVLLDILYNGQMSNRTTGELCKSPAVPLVSFEAVPPPQLTGISGCVSDSAVGLTTFGCTPTVHRLTLTGSNFLQLNTTTVGIQLGKTQYSLALFTGSQGYRPSGSDYTDTQLVIDLYSIYRLLIPQVALYGGTPIPFMLNSPRYQVNNWTTQAVYTQFAPLPKPVVLSIEPYNSPNSLHQCVVNKTGGLLVDCTAGWSRVQVTGHFLYPPFSAMVDGLPCYVFASDANTAYISLPLAAFNLTQRYDLEVYTPAGLTVFPSAVSLTSSPGVVYAVPCRDTPPFNPSSGTYLLAYEPGDRLVLRTVNIDVDLLANTTLSTNLPGLLLCGDLQQINATAISCVVPPRWAGMITSPVIGIQLIFTDGIKLSPTYGNLYDFLDAPRITGATGCSTTDSVTSDLQLNECQGGEVITLTGRNFNLHNWTLVIEETQSRCTGVMVFNSTTLICQLPVLDDGGTSLTFNTPYVLDMTTNVYQMRSNAVYITFVPYIPESEPDSPSSSSSSTTLVTVLVSVIGGVVVVLVVVILGIRRYKRMSRVDLSKQDESDADEQQIPAARVASRQEGNMVEMDAWNSPSLYVPPRRQSQFD